MKSISLLLLRVSTGIYLALWGLMKIFNTEQATKVSQKYYGGLLDGQALNYGLGGLQVLLGVLVILGIFRRVVYSAHAVWYFFGLVSIITYIIDPFGMFGIAPGPKLTFFPSTTLFFASLIMIAFKEDDTLSLDHKLGR